MVKNSFFVSATILGEFSIKTQKTDEDYIYSFYKVNAVAILFPYLRALISDLTGRGSEAPIIIPTLNIIGMMEKLEADRHDGKRSI